MKTKEIRQKIKSIKNTQKMTRAMEMVAASKMRKALDLMRASRPYASKIREVIKRLAEGRLEYEHPFLIERPVKRVGFIVISTDRGLCGGLNSNLLRQTVRSMDEWNRQNIPIDVSTIGKKAEVFFRRLGGNILASISKLTDRPSLLNVIGTVKVMLDRYEQGELDRIYLVHNEFVNTMVQKPSVDLLVPIIDSRIEPSEYSWDYLYEPEPKELVDALMTRYIESLVYQGLVENKACEQAARMIAMKNAHSNATDLIQDLNLIYNKARQAAITQELSEIVAGAAAV